MFLGRAAAVGGKHTSDETAKKIDEEVRRIVDEAYGTARAILTGNLDRLHAMAAALMQYETLDADQIDDLMSGREVRPPADWNDSDPTGTPSAGPGTSKPDSKPAGSGIGGPAGEH